LNKDETCFERQHSDRSYGLEGRVSLVTGASRGIGKATALGLAMSGATVVLGSRDLAALGEVASEIRARSSSESLCVLLDVRDPSGVERVVSGVVDRFGGLDILVNNAGISPVYKRAETVTVDEWDEIMLTNLRGAFLCATAAGRVMIQQARGSIVNVGSVGGSVGLERLIAYCAAKGGVQQMTRVLALEWARHNVRVNCVAPGFVETALTRAISENERLRDQVLAKTPMRRFAQPSEVVGAILYLLSDAASYVTGQIMYVDGGWTAA
jgi:NAD(P)-dependent dehydrogenase (short-subunit alcohol dehydrogenase family)